MMRSRLRWVVSMNHWAGSSLGNSRRSQDKVFAIHMPLFISVCGLCNTYVLVHPPFLPHPIPCVCVRETLTSKLTRTYDANYWRRIWQKGKGRRFMNWGHLNTRPAWPWHTDWWPSYNIDWSGRRFGWNSVSTTYSHSLVIIILCVCVNNSMKNKTDMVLMGATSITMRAAAVSSKLCNANTGLKTYPIDETYHAQKTRFILRINASNKNIEKLNNNDFHACSSLNMRYHKASSSRIRAYYTEARLFLSNK